MVLNNNLVSVYPRLWKMDKINKPFKCPLSRPCCYGTATNNLLTDPLIWFRWEKKAESMWEYYTLECIIFFLEHLKCNHPQYVKEASVSSTFCFNFKTNHEWMQKKNFFATLWIVKKLHLHLHVQVRNWAIHIHAHACSF